MSFLLDGAGNKPKAVLKSATTMKRPPPLHIGLVCVVLSFLFFALMLGRGGFSRCDFLKVTDSEMFDVRSRPTHTQVSLHVLVGTCRARPQLSFMSLNMF